MVDIKGKTFGRLTALYPTEKRDRFGIIIWMCQLKYLNMYSILREREAVAASEKKCMIRQKNMLPR